ncbi:MAG: dienelactone hydrolase family protein [Candidatus Omnitrophota bacterium]|nr:dienelactone hydrolase family protein [Candidatus Omnitrophota bacterium]
MISKNIEIKSGKASIFGDLIVPPGAKYAVIFSHGSGSGRFSPRNRLVAEYLNKAFIATLLVDLLTKDEDELDAITAQFRFDIELLTGRLLSATDWLSHNPSTKNFDIGYFGASTGAASALKAAAKAVESIHAIVSRGGRPDLAGESLSTVKAPVLLIVGGNDHQVIKINEEALNKIKAEKELIIVPGATHLFEEPGALEKVAELAKGWFLKHLKVAE